MKTKLALITTLLTLAGAALYTNNIVLAQGTPPPANTQAEQHALIRRAMHALNLAKTNLQMAKHDFGGHRVAAIKACDQALAECKEAMAYDKK